MKTRPPLRMEFDVGTIKHLGLQMYSTLPSVIGELVANAWDANATQVAIDLPPGPVSGAASEITIVDNGIGMSEQDIRDKYMIVGRDRRDSDGTDETPKPLRRKVMGRKGIGKFSAFGIAREMEVESTKDGIVSRFTMNYDKMLAKSKDREIEFPLDPPSGTVVEGTKITLRTITKFHNRRISPAPLRRRIARRFAVIGASSDFSVVINGSEISPVDRDLQLLLERDNNGRKYLWTYEDDEIVSESGWTVSGWIGALDRTRDDLEDDDIERGIVLMARGKLVQEPFVFHTTVGQQYALSYLVGELHVEFVDNLEDTIGTSRNSLVWETDANNALLDWGRQEVNSIARQWAEKRRKDNEAELLDNDLYTRFRDEAETLGKGRALQLADKLVRQTINNNPASGIDKIEPVIQTSLDFLRFDAFWEIVSEVTDAELQDTARLIELFREWQLVEAREMSRVTEGRISTITKFQELIEQGAMEVPTLHKFLSEFPWVIDPHWTLIDDEAHYSQLLRDHFPESDTVPESNRRIDFLCVGVGNDLYVVEIKRPSLRASKGELEQIEEYVLFIRGEVDKTTDPAHSYEDVIGYLICGDMVDSSTVIQKRRLLADSRIYVRLYRDLLAHVSRVHEDFLDRYRELQQARDSRRSRAVG